MIGLKIESDFFIDASEAIKIQSYSLTRITKLLMEIQIDFQYPTNITQSVPDPDNLIITFKDPLAFIDREDFFQLSDSEIRLVTKVQP